MQIVLVIDDDADLRDNIGLMLEIEGFHPAMAKDGKAGIKQALAMKPDLCGGMNSGSFGHRKEIFCDLTSTTRAGRAPAS
jgi:CheY-like chemotaxis protein